MSQEEIDQLRETFDDFDGNGDGHIRAGELASIMQGVPKDRITEYMRAADANGDGRVNFKEFVDMVARKQRDSHEAEELRETFKTFDVDGNGWLDKNEFFMVMQNMGQQLSLQDIDDLWAEADLDSDGKVSWKEFVSNMVREDIYTAW